MYRLSVIELGVPALPALYLIVIEIIIQSLKLKGQLRYVKNYGKNLPLQKALHKKNKLSAITQSKWKPKWFYLFRIVIWYKFKDWKYTVLKTFYYKNIDLRTLRYY